MLVNTKPRVFTRPIKLVSTFVSGDASVIFFIFIYILYIYIVYCLYVPIYISNYIKNVPTCFGDSAPSSDKVIPLQARCGPEGG